MPEHIEPDRRKFFKTCAALIAAGVIPVGCNESGTGDSRFNAPATSSGTPAMSKAAFSELPSTVFSVTHELYGVIDMTLAEVDNEIYSPQVEQFSISLAGPATPEFAEGNYDVYNDELGNIRLFLQPSENGGIGERRYRAIFSILAS